MSALKGRRDREEEEEEEREEKTGDVEQKVGMDMRVAPSDKKPLDTADNRHLNLRCCRPAPAETSC